MTMVSSWLANGGLWHERDIHMASRGQRRPGCCTFLHLRKQINYRLGSDRLAAHRFKSRVL
jgi:hypothetical protein